MVHLHISEYKNIITDLRSEIESLKMRLHEKAVPDFEEEVKPAVSAKKNEVCSCGRSEDLEEMKRIQEEIFENFQDRIQLRRALMEVEEQNALNTLEIKRRSTEVAAWKKAHGAEEPPEEIKAAMKNVAMLRANTNKNVLKKEYMNLQLMENITNTKKIRDEIPKRIKYKDKRDFLELLIKNHILELQNIELEINISIQEKSIVDLKTIIGSQRKILGDNGLDNFEDQAVLAD
jgi:kinesin family protein 18/19